MSSRDVRAGRFASRPGDPEAWVRAPEGSGLPAQRSPDDHLARLTIDVTIALRGRIKVAAFTRGVTVAVMLRSLLEESFPASGGSGE